MVVTYSIKLFRNEANRQNGILMRHHVLVAKTINLLIENFDSYQHCIINSFFWLLLTHTYTHAHTHTHTHTHILIVLWLLQGKISEKSEGIVPCSNQKIFLMESVLISLISLMKRCNIHIYIYIYIYIYIFFFFFEGGGERVFIDHLLFIKCL